MNNEQPKQKPGVSRRKLIQGAATLAAAATTACSLTSEQKTPAKPTDQSLLTCPPPPQPPPEKPAYRALALILFCLAPLGFDGTKYKDQDIANQFGFNPSDATDLAGIAAFRKKAITDWKDIPQQIFKLIKKDATSIYTGGDCPKTFDPLKYIADLSK